MTIVNILLDALYPWRTSTKNAIPDASLLSVVKAVLPAPAMMHIVVFDDQFGVEHSHQPRCKIWRCCMQAKATVARDFREHNVVLTDNPLVKPHR